MDRREEAVRFPASVVEAAAGGGGGRGGEEAAIFTFQQSEARKRRSARGVKGGRVKRGHGSSATATLQSSGDLSPFTAVVGFGTFQAGGSSVGLLWAGGGPASSP